MSEILLKLILLYEFKNQLLQQTEIKGIESLVLRIAAYLNILYGPFLADLKKYKVQSIQKFCVLVIKYLSHVVNVSQHVWQFNNFSVPQKLYCIYCLVHKLLHCKETTYLSKRVVQRRDVNKRNIRHRNTPTIPYPHTELMNGSFLFIEAYVDNRLPNKLIIKLIVMHQKDNTSHCNININIILGYIFNFPPLTLSLLYFFNFYIYTFFRYTVDGSLFH